MRLIAMLVLSLFLMQVNPGDMSGVWTLTFDPDFSGHPATAECTFKQDGRTLSVQCGGGPSSSGEVNGTKVSFQIVTGRDNDLRAVFTAVLDSKAMSMKGEWRLEGRTGKFTAKKK
jgi:hypothetical protein